MPYHVFIERPRETSALAVAKIASAIAQRFGLPSDAIAQRMAQGRFRVKANVDVDSARRIAEELEKLGAVCTIEDAATGARVTATATAPTVAGLPPPTPRPPPPPIPKPSLPPAKPTLESGLAAAMAADGKQQDLGALASLSVSALDGSEEKPVVKKTVGEGPRADLFAPPEADVPVELAIEVKPSLSIKTPPPPLHPSTPSPPTPSPLTPSPPTPHPPTPTLPPSGGGSVRNFAIGVGLAVVLGLAPAWLFGSFREGSAYDAPRDAIAKADAEYAKARPTSIEELQALDAGLDTLRGEQRGIMESAQGGIALFAGLIWLGASGLIGWLWIRRYGW